MYIGQKQIENTQRTNNLVSVEYQDGTKEILSELMFDKIVSEEPCDLTALREKRIQPVVVEILKVMRNWGVKLGELEYLSILLQTSIEENQKAALKELWRPLLPNLQTTDDVDLITVDTVLKSIKHGQQ